MKILDLLGIKDYAYIGALLLVASLAATQYVGKNNAQHKQAEAILALAKYQTDAAKTLAKQEKAAKERYAALTTQMSNIGTSYEDRLTKVESDKSKLAIDLRDARVKLRDELTCAAPGPGASAAAFAKFDADSAFRRTSASETIADADWSDAWIIELQNTIKAYQDGKVRTGQK